MHDPPGKPARSVGTIELEHSAAAVIKAHGVLHRLILLHRALCQHLPKTQNASNVVRKILLQKSSHFFLPKRLDHHTLTSEPFFHLGDRVRVLKTGQPLELLLQIRLCQCIDLDGIFHDSSITEDASVIDRLINVVFIPYRVRNRIVPEAVLDLHLDLDIALVVFLEKSPFVRSISRKVSGPAAIYFCRLTGREEVANEIFAFLQLLLLKSKNCADHLKRKGQAIVGSPDPGALPAGGIQVSLEGIVWRSVSFEESRMVPTQPHG